MKKIFLFLFLFLISTKAFAMDSPILSFVTDNPVANEFNYLWSGDTITSQWTGTENQRQNVIAFGGTISKLYVQVDVVPGGVTTRTFSLRVNGATSALTCTVTSAASTCSDLSNSVSVSAGDTVSIIHTRSGTPAAINVVYYGVVFSGTGASILSGGNNSNVGTGSVSYGYPMGDKSVFGVTDVDDNEMVFSPPGTISNLYISMSAAPGVGASYTFTLYKNDSGQSLTCQVSGGSATTCNDTSNSFSVSAGDDVTIQIVPAGSPVSTRMTWGIKFSPTTDGESPIGYGSRDSNNASNLYLASLGGVAGNATEANVQTISPIAFTAKNLYAKLESGAPPGVGKSWDYTLRVGGSSSALTCQISGTNLSCSDLVNTVSISATNLLNFLRVPTGTPTNSTYNNVGYTAYIAPTSSGVVKTIDGTAYANVKTINGTAVANVKTFNGAATQ